MITVYQLQIYSPDMEHVVGKISKQWSGLAKEWFTKADNFGINFPADLDVKVKASLLGALFLIVSLRHESVELCCCACYIKRSRDITGPALFST